MTFQTPNGVEAAGSVIVKRPVCALIEQQFAAKGDIAPIIVDNIERLRRQLALLDIEEVLGLGDIPPGASMLLLRADVLFELNTIEAMARTVGRGAQIDDSLAAVHVEAGDAAAALSKFRREDVSGWAPFQIQFVRLGKFKPAQSKSGWVSGLLPRRNMRIAKAALLPRTAIAADAPAAKSIDGVWSRSPGLDPLVRLAKVQAIQKDAYDAFGLRTQGWQAIGFLLLLVMISFGVLGWDWAGACIGLLAAGCFDLAERADDLRDVRLSKSLNALCIQALVISALWLFVVFAAGQGTTAQMPALLLMALPFAFVAAQSVANQPNFGRDASFGVYLHAILAVLAVTMLPLPLASLFFSACGLLLVLWVASSALVTVVTDLFSRSSTKVAAA